MTQPVNGNGSPEAMIKVENLSRFYGPVAALKDVSFQVNRGEIVGFLGPNGAGKTTTMRILTGFMPPSGGMAWVAGHDVVEDSMRARQATGYLPENTPLYTEMTVSGYLSFMARLRGVSDRREAVERVMHRVAIDDRADDLIAQLSKGLKQRVGVAQALVHDPEVVILDEPTIGLDPNQIREVQGLIGELRGNHTVILSTHILSEAEEVCDRILIIREGEIVADDALEQLAAQAHRGSETVRIAVPPDIDGDEVAGALTDLDGVHAVTPAGDGAYSVEVDDTGGVRPALAAAVMGRGWPLMELTPVHLTLRDIYMQATVGGSGSADADVGDIDVAGEPGDGADDDGDVQPADDATADGQAEEAPATATADESLESDDRQDADALTDDDGKEA